MADGERLLNSAVELSEQVLEHTSPAGKPRIESDVQTMKNDFSDMQVKLLNTHSLQLEILRKVAVVVSYFQSVCFDL